MEVIAITAEQLAAWKALEDAATEGPWFYRPLEYDDWGYVRAADGAVVAIGRAGQYVGEDGHAAHRSAGTDPYCPNAKFVAASRTAVPALVSEVERLKAALDRYRYAVDWTAADSWDGCSDCRARLSWARSLDGGRLSNDELAEIGKTFLGAERQAEEPKDRLRKAVEAFADAADYNLTLWDAFGDGPTLERVQKLHELAQQAKALMIIETPKPAAVPAP